MNLHPKVGGALLASAIVTVLVWGASVAGLDVPADVAAALVTIIGFAAGYLIPAGDWEPEA